VEDPHHGHVEDSHHGHAGSERHSPGGGSEGGGPGAVCPEDRDHGLGSSGEHAVDRVGVPGTPYHRLATLRPEWSRWWRPLLAIAVALVGYTIFASLLLVGTVVVLGLAGADLSVGRLLGDPTSPLDVFLQCGFAAIALPSALVGVRLGGWRPTDLLWSVAGRFRWTLLRGTAPIVLVVFALVAALPLVLGDAHLAPGLSAGRIVAVIALLVVLAPLQAAGEELAFRGLGQQAIGTWLRHPAWATVIPVPFALIGRGYSAQALIGAAVLGLACGYLAWKTGGMELPILLHLAAVGMTSLAALFGGPVAPQGPVTVVAIAVTALVLGTLTDHRERTGSRQAVTRPADAPAPRLARV